MRPVFIVALAIALALSGCCGQTPIAPSPGQAGQGNAQDNATAEGSGGAPQEPAQPATGEGTIIEATPGAGDGSVSGGAGAGKPASSQQDCATLSQNCGSCVAKAGCGWCKSTNACYLGDSEGPAADVACPEGEWAVTESGCSLEASGKKCEDQYNCAFCLSGTGCQWCIQGSKCAPAGTSEECFGGWLTQSYQCNYASR
jgi:hypothetical protein